MLLPITALYAALLTVIAIVLTQHVGQTRLASGVSLNHADNPALAAAIRRHANFTEHVPLAILLMIIIELNLAPSWVLHTMGVLLVASRLVHPFGIDFDVMRSKWRLLGALGTLAATLLGVITIVWQLLTD